MYDAVVKRNIDQSFGKSPETGVVPTAAVPALGYATDGHVTVAPPGFCNRGGSEVWVCRGSRVRSSPEADTFTAVHTGNL